MALFVSSAAHAQTAECEKIKSGSVPVRVEYQIIHDPTRYGGKDLGLQIKRANAVKVLTKNGAMVKTMHIGSDGKKIAYETTTMNGFRHDANDDKGKALNELATQNAFEMRKNFSYTHRTDDGTKMYTSYKYLRSDVIDVTPCKFKTLVFERLIHEICENGKKCNNAKSSAIIHYSPEMKTELKSDVDNITFFNLTQTAMRVTIEN